MSDYKHEGEKFSDEELSRILSEHAAGNMGDPVWLLPEWVKPLTPAAVAMLEAVGA